MATCEKCGRVIPEGSGFCGYCGRPQPLTSRGFRGLIVALLLVAAGAAVYGYFAYVRQPGGEALTYDRIATLYQTARQHERQGDDEAAAQIYRQIVESQPNWPTHRRNLARCLLRLGRFAEAEAQQRTAIDQQLAAPVRGEELLVWLHYELALARMGQGDYTGGEAALEEAKARRPALEQTPPYLVASAIARAGRGRQDGARELLEQALATDRDITVQTISGWLALVPESPEAPVLQAFLDSLPAEERS